MKKKILILIFIFICGICLTACDTTENKTYRTDRKSNVTVYVDGEANSYSFKIGEIAHIPVISKEGYYLKGFYSEPDGGEMYLDYLGDSVAKWEEGFPTVFYAQWADLSGYKSDLRIWRDSYHFWYDVDLRLGWELGGKRLLNILEGNWEQKIKITFAGSITAPIDHVYLYFQDKQYGGAEVFATKIVTTIPGEYVNFFYEVVVPAKIFVNEYEMFFRFSFGGDYYGLTQGYVKELSADFTFV